jgi:uncharacterized membrane protein YfcA
MIDLYYLPYVSVLVGFLVGLTGVGGGALMTPILIVFFGVQPIIAIATDLLFAVFTKISSAAIFAFRRTVEWRTAMRMWKGSVPGAMVGAALATLIAVSFLDLLLGILIAGLLFWTAFSLWRPSGKKVPTPSDSRFGAGPKSFLLGTAVSLTSVGAGALGMTVLKGLINPKKASALVGTDLVHAIPVGLIAGLSHLLFGHVSFELLIPLLIGSIPGAIFGSLVALRVRTNRLRKYLAAVLLVAALLLMLDSIGLV